jgi:phenylpyruvate tautomerase PptA (4-oxalocrotonate tautomerase family)
VEKYVRISFRRATRVLLGSMSKMIGIQSGWRNTMPLWKVYHPAGAYSAQDKKEFAEKVTAMYSRVPIPKFYVVMIFEEVAAESLYVGGASHGKFVRLKIDHLARTLPGPIIREWWVKAVDQLIAPFVRDRGYDWEVTIDEVPADLWSIQGEIPPPFESHAEKRWVKENKVSPYGLQEKLPVGALFTPGVTEKSAG